MTTNLFNRDPFHTREEAIQEISAEVARLEFGNCQTISLPVLAAYALAAGISTPSLDYVAGLSSLSDPDTARELFKRAASELGLPDAQSVQGRASIARMILRLMIDGTLSPLEGGSLLDANHRRNYHTDDWPEYLEIQGLASVWDEFPDQRAAIGDGILKNARSILSA
jgi:hypothetical protein